jgi:hypothetical protein
MSLVQEPEWPRPAIDDERSAAERGLSWYQANTGVQAGTVLRSSGPVNVTTDGAVVENLEVTGDITFSAANVTIRNCIVHGQILNTRPGSGAGGQYDNGYYGQNILIEHVEVDAPKNTRAIVSAWSTTMRFLKVHGALQGTSFAGYNTIEDSYFYNLRGDSGGHGETIISNGNPDPMAGRTTIRRNWLDARDDQARGSTWTWISGALNLYSDFGKINNVTIEDNYLTGAGYLLAPGVAKGSTGNNLTIRNNVFQPAGPYAWGPVYPSPLDPESTANWANNRLTNGTPIRAPH